MPTITRPSLLCRLGQLLRAACRLTDAGAIPNRLAASAYVMNSKSVTVAVLLTVTLTVPPTN